MRVLITSYGAGPHTYPMVPLAWAFRIEGHDVRMAGPPAIAGPMAESGIPGAVLGADADVSSFITAGKFRARPLMPEEDEEDGLARFVDGIAPDPPLPRPTCPSAPDRPSRPDLPFRARPPQSANRP